MLLHLLRFFETYCFDPQVYASIGSDVGELEVLFQRERRRAPWSWRRRDSEDPWVQESALGVLTALGDRGADLEALRVELNAAAMTQVVHASLLQRDAARLLGEHAVEDAVRGYSVFSQQAADLLRRVVFEELEGGDAQAADRRRGDRREGDRRRAHLRLVEPPEPEV